MEQTERYLISLDLDDTLLTSHQTITDNTKDYLRHLMNDGHVVLINTGRPPKAFHKFYQELGLTTAYAAINGALVRKPGDPSFMGYEHHFEKRKLLQLLDDCGGESCFLDLACGNDEQMNFMNHAFEDFLAFEEEGMTIHKGDFTNHIPLCSLFFFLLFKDQETKRKMAEFLSMQIDLDAHYYGKEGEISELYHPSVSKGTALDYLSEYYRIPKDHVISFGDSVNDLEMLRHSGIGVMMKNGNPILKQDCSLVSLEDNDHDGVMVTLQRLLTK